jgi:hypothetical protein
MANYWESKAKEKHKVFISFYHYDDQSYRDKFDNLFGHLFINKSVNDGDIDSDNSTEYIKKLIQQDYISDASVLVVLIGPNTYRRKHVDWEISAALNKKVGGYSGLTGILLPTFKLSTDNKYSFDDIPARLADNVKSKYSKIYTWNSVCQSESSIKNVIEIAFNSRISDSDKIDNSRLQMQRNL